MAEPAAVDVTLGGRNKVAHSILPPGVLGYRQNAKYIPFNPTEAKKLLAEAGYANGKGMPPLVLTHRDGQPDRDRHQRATDPVSQRVGHRHAGIRRAQAGHAGGTRRCRPARTRHRRS